jgi:hypothetical protein
MARTLVSLAFSLCAPLLAHGRVWIVDQNNGPGTHFTDLQRAVSAAADGDLIRVRSGF